MKIASASPFLMLFVFDIALHIDNDRPQSEMWWLCISVVLVPALLCRLQLRIYRLFGHLPLKSMGRSRVVLYNLMYLSKYLGWIMFSLFVMSIDGGVFEKVCGMLLVFTAYTYDRFSMISPLLLIFGYRIYLSHNRLVFVTRTKIDDNNEYMDATKIMDDMSEVNQRDLNNHMIIDLSDAYKDCRFFSADGCPKD